MYINKKGNIVLIIAVVIVCILLVAFMILVYFKATQTSSEIYDNMLTEIEENEDSKYGFGAIPDESMVDEDEIEIGEKSKPIIYVYPVLKKKK